MLRKFKKIKAIFLKFLLNSLFTFLIFFQATPNTARADGVADIATDLVSGMINVGKWLTTILKEIGCDQLEATTIISMLPVSTSTSVVLNAKGIMNILSGEVSKDSICAENVLAFKASLLAAEIAWKLKEAADLAYEERPETGTPADLAIKTALAVAYYASLVSAVAAYGEPFIKIGVDYRRGQNIAEEAKICLNEGDPNFPLPYTDAQVYSIFANTNTDPTISNLKSINNKLCVEYKGEYKWLKNGECTAGSDTICVENMKGYQNVLCAMVPVGCPCIANVQHGIYSLPEFKKDASGNISRNDDGSPQFLHDPASYKNSFLKNCRISRVDNGYYKSLDENSGIVDETCKYMKGHSKRKFSLTGGMVECLTNTARNIFEKPIFSDLFSTGNSIYTKVNNYYNLDLSLILDYQSKINQILTNRSFNSLNASEKTMVVKYLNDFLNTPSSQICYTCGSSGASGSTAIRKTFLEKYYNDYTISGGGDSCKPTPTCCTGSPDNPYNAALEGSCYTDIIEDIISYSGERTALKILYEISNFSGSTDLGVPGSLSLDMAFTNLYESVSRKKSLSDYAFSLQAQSESSSNVSILKWSLFDKFNNQIKFLSVILLTLWLFLLGYRILVGEFKFSTPELTTLIMQVGLFYYLVLGDLWKKFLFGMAISVSQGIGSAAIYVGDLAGQYQSQNSPGFTACSYEANTILATLQNGELTCPVQNNIAYDKECTNFSQGRCQAAKCIPRNSYIIKPNYENPYLPVRYYDASEGKWTYVKVYCKNSGTSASREASLILNNSLGKYIFYCPDADFSLEEGYRVGILNELFHYTSGINVLPSYTSGNQVINTALKTTDASGMIFPVTVVSAKNRTEVNTRIANAYDLETLRSELNYRTSYPVIEIDYGQSNGKVYRDTSYLKFFDTLDCKIMRFLFLGFGSQEMNDIDTQRMDVGNAIGGVLAALKMVFGFFPFGILVFIFMILIAATLLMITLRAVQTYVVGIFGLVMNIYVSPFFFMLGLFPSFKGGRDMIIKNIVSYMIVPSIGFLSVGIYLFILDIAFFGDPSKYSNLFNASGFVRSDCYASDPANAPLACLINKIISKIDPNVVYTNLLLNLALGMYAGAWAGVMGSAVLSSLFGISDTIQLFLPFLSKLLFALLLSVGGLAVLDTVENTLKALVGMTVDTKMGTIFDGGIKDIISGVGGAIKGFI